MGCDKNGIYVRCDGTKPMLSKNSVNPISAAILFAIPVCAKKLRIRSKVTNCGTAMVITNIVRHIFFNFVFELLMNDARNIPRKKLLKVAAKAHINVQARTLPNA